MRIAAAAALMIGLCVCSTAQDKGLVAYWPANGSVADVAGNHNGLDFRGKFGRAAVHDGFYFDGTANCGINVADCPAFEITGSLGISAWIRSDSPCPGEFLWREILFRGDDRPGNDPYTLAIDHSGKLVFTVDSADNVRTGIDAAIPSGQLVFVEASLDDATGQMQLFVEGRLVGQTLTERRPMPKLDPNSRPGLAIGAHPGFPNSIYRMPFHGLIDELKLYKTSVLERYGVLPSGINALSGQMIAGGLAELVRSDHSYAQFSSDQADAGISIEVAGVSTAKSVRRLDAFIASRSSIAGITQRTEFRNVNSGQHEMADSRPATTSDQLIQVTPETPSNYIDPKNGRFDMLLKFRPSGPIFDGRWEIFLDQCYWTCRP